MQHWTLSDIPWQDFDASKVNPEHVSLVKAACMVEHDGADYARYLCEVFEGDAEFQQAAVAWAQEEVQHGMALRKWAELADPAFDFDRSFAMFAASHDIPTGAEQSVRGSRCGELIARCVVESGTSAYYTAIKEASDEPVLKILAAKIAADEYRHYQLFYRYLQHYQKQDEIGISKRFWIALKRVMESSDDELAYAFFSSHLQEGGAAYNRKDFANRYFACVAKLYTKTHIERMTSMILKAVGIRPQGRISRIFHGVSWFAFCWRADNMGLIFNGLL